MYMAETSSDGQTVLHSVTGNEPAEPEDARKSTFIPHILLSCVVFWLCGFVFGLVGLTLARKYSSHIDIFVRHVRQHGRQRTVQSYMIIKNTQK